jgi:hypothetical protein
MSVAANVVFIRQLMRDDDLILVAAIIIVRLLVILFSCVLACFTFSLVNVSDKSLSSYLDPRAAAPFSLFKILLTALMLFDPSLIRLLPWRLTKFSKRSQGYPNWTVFVSSLCVIVVLSVALLAICAVSLQLIDKNRSWQLLFTALMALIYLVYAMYILYVRILGESIQSIGGDAAGANNQKDGDIEMDDIHVAENIDLDDIFKEDPRESERYSSGNFKSASGSFGAGKNPSFGGGRPESFSGEQSAQLQNILVEMAQIFDKINDGKSYDAPRLDRLFDIIESNATLKSEYEEAMKSWKLNAGMYANNCASDMRGFIPPRIMNETPSVDNLTKNGLSSNLAKRIVSKPCLWLITLNSDQINNLTEAQLLGQFSPFSQGLDMVELAALYSVLPNKFTPDASGEKKKWKAMIEGMLKRMLEKRDNQTLSEAKARNPVYTGQSPVYQQTASTLRKKISFR